MARYQIARGVVFGLTVMTMMVGSTMASATTLSYELLPGSSITPYSGATPIGPEEPLTGTFQWVATGFTAWNATGLSFSSPSFLLTLNSTAVNDLATSILPGSTTYFGEVVDISGLSITVGRIAEYSGGTYLGTQALPTFVTYPDLRIGPPGGGLFAARLTFSAQLVPEPSTLALAAFGFVALAAWGWRRRPWNDLRIRK